MRRGFVNGIGWCFTVAAIWFPTEPANRYYLIQLNENAVAAEFGLVFAALIAFFVAMFLSPGRSWSRAFLGGALGFFAPMAAVLVLAAVFAGGTALLSRPPEPTPTPPCSSGIDCR